MLDLNTVDWKTLPFGYYDTDYNVRCYYRDGSTNGKGCGWEAECSSTYPVRGICPEGWHLPANSEWNALFTAVGGRSAADMMLKSTSGWFDSGNGTDAYSFAALPAGYRYVDGSFTDEGEYVASGVLRRRGRQATSRTPWVWASSLVLRSWPTTAS